MERSFGKKDIASTAEQSRACLACHAGDHAAQIKSAANLARGQVTTAKGYLPLANAPQRAQVTGRNGQSCRSLVHGSNHPAGAKLLR